MEGRKANTGKRMAYGRTMVPIAMRCTVIRAHVVIHTHPFCDKVRDGADCTAELLQPDCVTHKLKRTLIDYSNAPMTQCDGVDSLCANATVTR